ncbi:MAG: hypothetical protein ACJ0QJ_05240 [Flavobacteriales bacterium]
MIDAIVKAKLKKDFKKENHPYGDFIKLRKGENLPEPTKGAIVVGPIRMSVEAHLFEGLIGYLFRLKRYKVYALLCGKKLSACESKPLDSKLGFLKCSTCLAKQEAFCETFGIEPLWLNDYISKEEDAKIENAVDGFSIGNMLFEGIDLSLSIESGIMRVLKTSQLTTSENKYIKQFGRSAAQTFTASKNILNAIKPKSVIMSHGTYATWGSLQQACEVTETHTAVWGRGYVGKGNVMAAHNKSYLFQNTLESIDNFKDLELSEEQTKKIQDYFYNKRNPNKKVDYVNYYSTNDTLKEYANIFEILNISKEKPLIGMFPNIPWDGQAFSSSELFPTIREFITESIEWVKGQDVNIVIRAHPAEHHVRSDGQVETFKDVLFELYPELPDNVHFLDADSDISSYLIEKDVCVALLYAGTIGLEFSMNHTPVIQAGKNFNSNKGFIFEPESKEHFGELLDMATRVGLDYSEEMYQNCLKYAYHWIYRRHFPETVVNFEGAQVYKSYNLKNSSDLLNDPSMTRFIQCVEKKEDFVFG